MRVMVIVKATEESEAEKLPMTGHEEMFEAMGKYNEELVKAGIMISGDGLKPSKFGKRIHFNGTRRSVTDGPFTETKELVAGFWVWQVRSMDEAIAWVKRAPFEDTVVELRKVAEPEDFGDQLTPELLANEQRLRAKIGSN